MHVASMSGVGVRARRVESVVFIAFGEGHSRRRRRVLADIFCVVVL